ncbi:MAG: AAA family ATPase [Bacteroidales bacterium]|nr:AAA family ATPase [Bacteroidales bacterium]
MNSRLQIKNFRIFDAEGASFDIKPITFLTGTNSSGKSSLTKAVLLLNDILRQYQSYGWFEKCVLNFTGRNYQLGTFQNVLNKRAKAGDSISFSYSVETNLFSSPIDVCLSFKPIPGDELNNGYFDSCVISTSGIELVKYSRPYIEDVEYTDPNGDYICDKVKRYPIKINLSLLKDVFFRLLDDEREEEVSKRKSMKSMHKDEEQVDKWEAKEGIELDLILNHSSSNISPRSTKEARRMHSLFYFPIFDKIGKLDKAGIRKFFGEIEDEEFRSYALQIADLFDKSNFSSFADYYLACEQDEIEFLSKMVHETNEELSLFATTGDMSFSNV